VDHLSHHLGALLVGEPPPAQVRLHLGLEHLDHVFDHAVQLLGRAATQLGDGRRGIQELGAERLRALAAVDHPELEALASLEVGHTRGQR
jgi:hypothetical protein